VEVFEEKLNALCMQWLIDNGRLRLGGGPAWGVCCVHGECVVWGSSMGEWQDGRIQRGGVARWEGLAWGSGRVGGSGFGEWQGDRVAG